MITKEKKMKIRNIFQKGCRVRMSTPPQGKDSHVHLVKGTYQEEERGEGDGEGEG